MNFTLFETRHAGDTLVITPTSDLGELRYATIHEEGQAIKSYFEGSDAKNVVVDFCETDYIGSSALSLLVGMSASVDERGGRLHLCNLSEHQRAVLDATGLGSQWHTSSSLQAALESMDEKHAQR